MRKHWGKLCGPKLAFKHTIAVYIVQNEAVVFLWNCSNGEHFFGTHGVVKDFLLTCFVSEPKIV